MFLDEAKINVKAGDGGNGMASFHYLKGSRKKIASGGNGGRGGNAIIKASSSISTLYSFKRKFILRHRMVRVDCRIKKMAETVKTL